jgi:hypothetical protein
MLRVRVLPRVQSPIAQRDMKGYGGHIVRERRASNPEVTGSIPVRGTWKQYKKKT